MASDSTSVVIGGQARLPKELYAEGVFQVVAEIEPESGRILDVDFSPSTGVASRRLKSWLQGITLPDGVGPVLQRIEDGFVHKAKKAVLTAIKDLAREFREFQGRQSGSLKPEK